MPGVLETISCAPESTVNIDDEGKRRLVCRLPQIKKLILIGAISHSRIGSRRRQRENGIRHIRKVNPLTAYSYRNASIGSRFAARIAGTIPLITPTTAKIEVDTIRIIGETISRMSPASAWLAMAL